ncbi:MAG: AAA family ATPase [Accumulibacter sp.]|jgi:predicted ATP-binding protein involved in virulence|uniref:AAA family ATPase n=1 Tax=Accumulibacter sp. TaxID=2053492 RepID=UPI002FC35376
MILQKTAAKESCAMRLKKITLNNFRCFESFEVTLHPRLTVFVGENGAGKTAVLDGIATALTPVLNYLSSANQRLTGRGIGDADFRVEPATVRAGKERWKLADFAQVVAETVDGLKWDYWRPSGTKGQEPKTKHGLTELKNRLLTISESYKSSAPALTPVFSYFGARRGYIEVPERLRESKENYAYPTSALIGALDSMSDFKELLKWFDREEAAELRANKGVASDDYVPSPALDAVRETIKTLLDGTYQNPYFNRDHKFVVEPSDGGAPLLVTQLSQGYQSMLALGVDFARRLVLANGHMNYGDQNSIAIALEELHTLRRPDKVAESLPVSAPLIAPAIMLVDEIDLHLHPSWQQRVLDDLMRAFPSTQFIVTTHSPQVISTVRRENIRAFSTDTDGRTVATEPLANPYGQPSGDVLQSVMLVNPQPPVDEKSDLDRLTNLVDQGHYESDEAKDLFRRLGQAFGPGHPQLLRLQRSVSRQTFLVQRDGEG